MSVDELENAIIQLSPPDMARFAQWFDEYRADQWDKKIEQDILAGKFDAVASEADADFDAGRCTPL
jgi:hypothetical protein